MRVGAIYDIHSNLPALEAVLKHIHEAKVDQILVGGDVFPGPMPRETIARLLDTDIPVQFIRGNGDREVLASMRGEEIGALPEQAREVIHWTASQLSHEYEDLLAGWPEMTRLSLSGLGEVLFCHATPRSDTEVFTLLTPEERLVPIFENLNVSMVVCGHTHMQFDRMVGRVRLLNAGSVGMPFAQPGAYWLLVGPDVQFRHTPYDFAKAADCIRETQYPQAEEFAAHSILQPPSEAEMLEAFSRGELRGEVK
jgi:putative phosphoesterase